MNPSASLAVKLQLVIEAANSQKEVARLARVSDGTLINWLRGRGARESKLRQVARLIGVSFHWLRDGKGGDEGEIAAFRAMLRGDTLLRSTHHPLVKRGDPPDATYDAKPDVLLPDGGKGRYVPLLTCAQAARWGARQAHVIREHTAIFALDVDDCRAFAIKVLGNSMEPAFREGDLVVCAPTHEIQNGEAAVVRTRREQVFINYWRQCGPRVLVESANDDYKPIDLPLAEITGAWPIVQTISWQGAPRPWKKVRQPLDRKAIA